MLTFVIQSHRGVEQLVARRAHNPEAGGSSPSPATKNTDTEKSVSVFSYIATGNRELVCDSRKELYLRSALFR